MDCPTRKNFTGTSLLQFGLIPLLIAALVVGCAVLANFRSNTLVKTYSLTGEMLKPSVDSYDIDFLIRAREVGNMTGTSSFRFVFELKSSSEVTDQSSLPIPRIKSMRIDLPITGDSLVFSGDRVAGRSLDTAPQRFRNRIYEHLAVDDVSLPDIHQRIDVIVEFAFYDPATHKLTGTETVSGQFVRSQQLAWFPLPKSR